MIAWIQTKALLVEAYRELNAKKLFWLALGINAIVIAVYASLGIDDGGVTFWHWRFPESEQISGLISAETFYKAQFVAWGIPFLNWASTILALISTAAIIPDMITGGAIETMLSKPIGRVRLLLTKFATGLLFVTLQVGVFSLGCFLVIGIRGQAFEPQLFLAIPIVVIFYSYLFSVCVLLGLLTRSTIASLMLTGLFWFMLVVLNATDAILVSQREGTEARVQRLERQVETQLEIAEERLAQMEEQGQPLTTPEGKEITGETQRQDAVNPALRMTRDRLEKAEASEDTWQRWAALVRGVKTPLPKTNETISLLQRWLITQEELARAMGADVGVEHDSDEDAPENAPAMADPEAQQRAQEAFSDRSVGWIVGTSLGFEAVILAIASIVFARRDF